MPTASRKRIARLALALALLVMICSVFFVLVPPQRAMADAGDNYPNDWKSNTTWYNTCTGDTWGYCQRWCTSWVAWALSDRNNFNMNSASGLYDMGDASAWKQGVQNAINAGHTNYSINTTPAV